MKNTELKLKNLCGDITGFIDQDKKTYHIEKDKKGHYLVPGQTDRIWITTPEFFEHLSEKTNATIYVCPRTIDAKEVAILLRDNNDKFNLYIPEIDHIWHKFAIEQRIHFVHTDDEKLNFQYLTKEKTSISEEKLFIDNDLMRIEGGITIASTSVSSHYQNYLLGGAISATSNAVLGYKSLYFQIKHPDFYKKIQSLKYTNQQHSTYKFLDLTVINEKLDEQISFDDQFNHIHSNEIKNLESGVFISNENEGSGKTSVIAAALEKDAGRILAVTNTESLTGELSRRLNCISYKNLSSIKEGFHFNRVATCLNSLTNPVISAFNDSLDFGFFDEFLSIMDGLASGSHISESERPRLLAEVIHIIKNTPKIIIADANLNQAAIDFIKSIRNDIFIFDFDYTVYKKPDAIFYNSKEEIVQKIINRAAVSTECITIFTDTKKMAFTLENALLKTVKNINPDEIALLHAENKAGDEFRTYDNTFWNDIDANLKKYKIMISSPVIGSGISLEENIDENTFCFFSGHLNVPSYLQQIARNRRATTLHLFFDERSEYEHQLINSEEKLSIIGTYNALDIFNLTRQQTEQDIKANKLEYFMRAMIRKGYSLSWDDQKSQITDEINLKKYAEEAKEDRVIAVQNASNKPILDSIYQSKLIRKSRTTQAESDEITRFNLAKTFLDDPDINTKKKIDALPESFKILRNLELIRSSLPIVKRMDEEDSAIASKKRNYVDKRDMLLILKRAESPSKTICKNIIKEFISSPGKYQLLISANLTYWKKEFETIDHVHIVSKLCKIHLGFELTKKGKKIETKHTFNYNEVDFRRQENDFSILENSLENEQIFYNFFQKKLKTKNRYKPYNTMDAA